MVNNPRHDPMRIHATLLGLASATIALTSNYAVADTIYLLDGSSIPDVKIGSETFKEISYRAGSKSKTVKTDNVLRLEFTAKSPIVDRADTAAVEGQVLAAIDDFNVYLEGFLSDGRRPRFKWEPAYAMYRLVELNGMVGDVDALVASADLLIDKAPESRYLPMVYLAKAEAQFMSGKSPAAQKTLKEFLNLIQAKSLSRRWQVEQKLATILFDSSIKGKDRISKLNAISDQAGEELPLVRNRAEVAIGEALTGDKKFKEAEEIFGDITENPQADQRTLAAAYTGLGDCLYYRANKSKGEAKQELLVEAAKAYMRVVVVYKDQSLYVPKAMFWAGRVFDASTVEGDKAKAQKLYGQVSRDYRGSQWATEANAFRKR
ncbi:MAG: tetratricopeptide (TPR) repeat protein [Planctomycetota bacterium]